MKHIKNLLSRVAPALFAALAALAIFSSCENDQVLPPVPTPEGGPVGTGTWDNPMTAYQARICATNSNLANVWVKGYIVGTVNTEIGTVLTAASADFEAPAQVNTNLLIATSPDETDWEKCATVQLPSGAVRNALNLVSNPGNLHKLVCLQGTTGSNYCGVGGVRSVIAYTFDEVGIEGSDQPAIDPFTVFYNALGENDPTIDWTFDNVNLPAGLNDIWTWTEYNGRHYLNGTAFGKASNGALGYAVSPEIVISPEYSEIYVSFDHAASYQTTLRELCAFAVREAGASEWTELPIPNWPPAGSWTFVDSGNIDLSAFAGKTIQIAFKYGASAAGADTWEIRNVKVKGTKN